MQALLFCWCRACFHAVPLRLQVMSQEIQEAVYKQQEVIKDKQLSVKQDLDQVEPAVIEAQNGRVGFKWLLCCSEEQFVY